MYDVRTDILDAFRAAPTIFEALLHNCTQAQAQAARGGDENWSVVEVVCHLRDAEERALERTRAMRDQDEPLLEGYDQDTWARERNYAAADLREALAAFLRFRAQHIVELEALEPVGWARAGRHAEFGRITIGEHSAHLVSHDCIHAAQIARQLQNSSEAAI